MGLEKITPSKIGLVISESEKYFSKYLISIYIYNM